MLDKKFNEMAKHQSPTSPLVIKPYFRSVTTLTEQMQPLGHEGHYLYPATALRLLYHLTSNHRAPKSILGCGAAKQPAAALHDPVQLQTLGLGQQVLLRAAQ
jgi:hypothetical protein